MTLCFVLWRFDFGVLTFDFHILSFLFCVLCTMLFILNGAIHEVEIDIDEKTGANELVSILTLMYSLYM